MRQQLKRGQQSFDLNVDGLLPGQYFVKILNGSEVINRSFSVIK
jgi:hypothetical protein